MTHRLRLTVPADHQVAFELPAEITGEVEITVTPVATVSAEVRKRAVRKRAAEIIGRRVPRPTGTHDSAHDRTELLREDRESH